jgi:hypothetical protein
VDEGFEKTVINHKRGSFVAYNLAIRWPVALGKLNLLVYIPVTVNKIEASDRLGDLEESCQCWQSSSWNRGILINC